MVCNPNRRESTINAFNCKNQQIGESVFNTVFAKKPGVFHKLIQQKTKLVNNTLTNDKFCVQKTMFLRTIKEP